MNENITGIITEIQHFSLHDGPGIRTTVFFKGCNMRCAWCHNPETYNPHPQLMHYKSLCTNCGVCSCVKTSCDACGHCAKLCVNNARKISGISITSDEVIEILLEDMAFYKRSNGGVTLSGGEVMLQPEFALSILKGCKDHGIHTCIESNMSVPLKYVRSIVDLCDLVIMDIKFMDNKKHEQWTGTNNHVVLENYKALVALKIPIIVRTPIIDGINDDEIGAISAFISGNTNLIKHELMPYHSLGEGKRAALGLKPFR